MDFTTLEVEQYVIDELLMLRRLSASLHSVAQTHAEKLKLAGKRLENAASRAVKDANAKIQRNDQIYEFLCNDSLGRFR